MKNKPFFLLFALMLGFATVNAQQSSNEKYDYAIVEFTGKTVFISTSEGVSEERKINESSKDASKKEFLIFIKEMNEKGWELVNTDYYILPASVTIPPRYVYHMQKKRTN